MVYSSQVTTSSNEPVKHLKEKETIQSKEGIHRYVPRSLTLIALDPHHAIRQTSIHQNDGVVLLIRRIEVLLNSRPFLSF